MIATATATRQQNAPSNAELADRLEAQADRIAAHDENPYHVMAYRRAAETLRSLERPVVELLRERGRADLESLPGIGRSLARRIERMAQQPSPAPEGPERQFATLADIGPGLARRIRRELEISTLAELRAAAYDGRLARVPGIGPKRLRAVRESLAARLGSTPRSAAPGAGPAATTAGDPRRAHPGDPPVETLLQIDRRYRQDAEQDKLPRIAPRRFNPTAEAWLPVLRTERGAEHYTALYSNTARAHELGTTKDWVVVYRNRPVRGQWTVVTAQFGKLRGRRIVRGREAECAAYYAGGPAAG